MTSAPEQVSAELGVPSPAARAAVARGLLACARPGQWVKNLLVVAVPFAARGLGDEEVVGRTAAAAAVFVVASAGTYLLNDARDAARDRAHPLKRFRPVAAGVVPARLATTVGLALLAVAVLAAWATAPALAVVVAGYVAVTTLYSCGLKRVAWLEIVAVAAGFVLRAVAGGAATGLPVSGSFLLVIAAGATFMVAGKRYAELRLLTGRSGAHRAVLTRYPARVLWALLVAAALVVCAGYAVWALHRGHGAGRVVDLASLLPVAFGLGRYTRLVRAGAGGAPEEVLTTDRGMLAALAGWIVLFGAGLALG